ncbi:1-deoxy-D-xylulose 5-phosphate reductoisomerase [Desulfolithobacter dissulfuricans]|uniref:1-deoxy-D-xylulose 5-phosphate reductoisomerase n=1 Tax=Desulfolithobacter dissulfuricans TaxID=2795293 RepID=A0A915UAF6_9BACT|nr:1-deoxy-D-xylulose-5-phosphate reductoisomerase [Desulfolithobacter dissulfuricans]BCO09936.1 1-deoxy-D-xylulose 5-phosphate reductoisomerase [Desulfolithobacter dissulfuricans]
MKCISLLGSTGSIGQNVLAVVRQFSDRFRIVGLSAGSNVRELARQVLEFEPQLVSIGRPELVDELAALLPDSYHRRIFCGTEGNRRIATMVQAQMVVSAVVGAVGLLPTLDAIMAGKDIGLANKETLVMAGRLIMEAVREHRVRLLPIDSEHSAIFQALEAGRRQDVGRIILTASGGPFRAMAPEELVRVTPAQALAHPNWDMGRKISIDSATLMNKGLEVIEARWLFDVSSEQIGVVVHPQSVVHSLVEYVDGSVVAQLGIPDMRIPIAYALSYPERLGLGLSRLSLSECGRLDFEKPDYDRFPALRLAFDCLEQGGTWPAVLNAANEIAVDAFLDGRIGFTDISRVVARTTRKVEHGDDRDLDAILEADRQARIVAEEEVCLTGAGSA